VRDDIFRLKADYYTMDIDNYITACAFPGGGGSVYFCNARGISTVQGVELQSMYDAGFFFAGASYTYTQTDLPSQQAGFGAPNYVPEHVAIGSAGIRVLDRKLMLGGRVSYFTETDVGTINSTPGPGQPPPYASRYMPGYTLVDFFSNYTFSQNLDFGFNVTNLFDEDYTPGQSTTFSYNGQCYGSNSAGCNTTGMGRTLYVTARARF
jgi:hemoglobin/transferrin/lactoferrin receptor protein